MFIYSVRASTIKFFFVIALVLVLLVSVVTVGAEDAIYTSAEGGQINYGGIKTREDRIAFISQFGIEVDPDSESSDDYKLPENLDRALSGYNQLQIAQGLNLTKYVNKKVTHYSYRVTNSKKTGEIYVNLLIHKQKVVACDVSSTEGEGFVLPLTEAQTALDN